jgi:hypothetical protein
MEMPLHPVLSTVSSAGIVGSVFLDDTANAEHYLKLLQDHFGQLFKAW